MINAEDLGIKEDTAEIQFNIKVFDNRLPNVYVSNDGGPVFGVFYLKASGITGKPSEYLLDHFSISGGSTPLQYQDAVSIAKDFFEKYLRSKILQRAYTAKITRI
jgi:hypothetical protein